MTKKNWILIAGAAILLLVGYNSYNSIVTLQEDIRQNWSQVENQYQRRADLIPNLVSTVKGYASHEKEALTAVIEARSKATSTNIDASNLTAESMQQFQQAQNGLSSALSKLMVVVERYPDLKANESFLQLQAQLEGTENRIATERRNFNTGVGDYNKKIKRIPGKLFALMFGFEEEPYFEAEDGNEVAPEINFD